MAAIGVKHLLSVLLLAVVISFFILVNDPESTKTGWIYAGLGMFAILAYSERKRFL